MPHIFIRLRWLWVNTSYRLGPSVNALQCLTGKVDNNNNNNNVNTGRHIKITLYIRVNVANGHP